MVVEVMVAAAEMKAKTELRTERRGKAGWFDRRLLRKMAVVLSRGPIPERFRGVLYDAARTYRPPPPTLPPKFFVGDVYGAEVSGGGRVIRAALYGASSMRGLQSSRQSSRMIRITENNRRR